MKTIAVEELFGDVEKMYADLVEAKQQLIILLEEAIKTVARSLKYKLAERAELLRNIEQFAVLDEVREHLIEDSRREIEVKQLTIKGYGDRIGSLKDEIKELNND